MRIPVASLGGRALVAIALAGLLLLPSGGRAAQRFAAMVVDANTGAVLYEQAGTEPRYPASLTKMMTLYLVFEQIERGRLSYQTRIRASEHAAAAAPSKLNLEPGEEITVIDAIKALVTKSANDVAVALAEHIAGSEANFAALMTEKARALGMTATVFRNASGLPDPEQVTTARDMLTLALRLQDHFPQHYPLFATRSFTYKGRTYSTHNGLLRSFEGTDGIKTGYIRASGFNLVASVRRGERRVVGAIFGGASTASRNAQMRALLTRALYKASTVRTRFSPPSAVARATPPAPSRSAPATATLAAATDADRLRVSQPPAAQPRATLPEDGGEDRRAAEAPRAPARTPPAMTQAGSGSTPGQGQADGTPRLIAPPRPAVRSPSTLQQQAEELAARSAAAALVSPAALRSEAVNVAGSGKAFAIQLGAFGSSGEAEKALSSALERASQVLAAARPVIAPVQQGGRRLIRARFSGFDAETAARACRTLQRARFDCLVVRAE
jgi:D-alanyl-D-alanine carboxypeptidase